METGQTHDPSNGKSEDSPSASTEKAQSLVKSRAPDEKYWWKKGQSGNPGGRVPMPKELRGAFRSYSHAALSTLVDGLVCRDPSTRLRAAEAILTRGYGRGESIVPDDQETPTEDRAKVQYNWSLLSNEQWQRFKEIQAEMKELLAIATVR